ncbi:MAG: alpha/beta hydrolase [Actinomycetota bacterium]|nr:alpha/beta hydrolase [Actinomycetota bacterium]
MHGTGTHSGYFEPVAGSLAATHRLITYDRLGWGGSEPVGDYTRTSVVEQAITAGGLLRRMEIRGGTVVGVGFGAVVALELALAEPDMVAKVVMVEPPLLGLVTAATEGMSADVAEIREAARGGGERAAYELFLSGELHTLGAGAGRLAAAADRSAMAAHSFLVELPAVPAWPLDAQRLALIEAQTVIATTPSTPPLLLEAADGITPRIPGSSREFTVRDGAAAVQELLA